MIPIPLFHTLGTHGSRNLESHLRILATIPAASSIQMVKSGRKRLMVRKHQAAFQCHTLVDHFILKSEYRYIKCPQVLSLRYAEQSTIGTTNTPCFGGVMWTEMRSKTIPPTSTHNLSTMGGSFVTTQPTFQEMECILWTLTSTQASNNRSGLIGCVTLLLRGHLSRTCLSDMIGQIPPFCRTSVASGILALVKYQSVVAHSNGNSLVWPNLLRSFGTWILARYIPELVWIAQTRQSGSSNWRCRSWHISDRRSIASAYLLPYRCVPRALV